MVQLRGLMYIGFALAVLVTWYMNRRKSTQHKSQNALSSSALETPTTIDDALKHPRWKVRIEAIEQLQTSDNPDALGYLVKMLNDSVSDVRQVAIDAIIPYGNQALGDLSAILETGGLNAREAVVKVLCGLGTPETVDLLIKALQDESAWVRVRAVQGLSAIGGDRVHQALENALNDSHPDVVNAVQNALRDTGQPDSDIAVS